MMSKHTTKRDDKMPDRLVEVMNNLPPEIAGALLAVFMSIIRIIYDKHETSTIRILLESVICGALTLTVGAAISALGLNANWNMFIGGSIGFLGVLRFRAYALHLLHRRIKGKIPSGDDK